MTEPVFLLGFAMAATTVVVIVRTIAGAFSRNDARSDFAQLREQLEQQAAALEDAQAGLASQAEQVAQLHERLDFAERLLTQARDRAALGPGDKRD